MRISITADNTVVNVNLFMALLSGKETPANDMESLAGG